MSASKQVFTGRLPADPIGVTAGGDDCLGLNGVIRATVRIARLDLRFGDRP